jgi:hypothetical protein
MNMKTWSHLAIGGALLIPACLAFSLLAIPRETIRYDRFADVMTGMTKDEVNATLGCRPGDYRTGETDTPFYVIYCNGNRPHAHTWRGDSGDIIVWFGRDDKVVSTKYWQGVRTSVFSFPCREAKVLMRLIGPN